MKLLAEIFSYWTSETDVAKVMAGWEEFQSGTEYDVDLLDARTNESVCVRLVHEDQDRWVAVSASSNGKLFERVLGRVAIEMAKNSEIHVRACDPEA